MSTRNTVFASSTATGTTMPGLERERVQELRQRLAVDLHLLVGVAGVVEMRQREVAHARPFEVGKLFDVVGHQVDDDPRPR